MPLNIAIVNDTAMAVEALYRAINSKPDYRVLWVAQTGTEAVDCAVVQPPDLILMDLNMPGLEGAEATRQIMQKAPCAILIVTASLTSNTAKVFEAMGYGALDAVTTPAIGSGNAAAIETLLHKIAMVAHIARGETVRESPAKPSTTSMPATSMSATTVTATAVPATAVPATAVPVTTVSATAGSTTSTSALPQTSLFARPHRPPPSPQPVQPAPALVVIGTSTGGPHALQQILSQLPPPAASNRAFEAAVVVIQHIDAQFAPGLVNWLNEFSTLPVMLARNGDRPEAGKVLLAGTNDHLILRPNQTLRYIHEPSHYSYRPSVDVFFRSVARYWQQPGVALLLTGMGKDGAEGMARLHTAGWHTIAQEAQSCAVFGMPKAAIEQGTVKTVLPLSQIAPHLLKVLTQQMRPF